MAQKNPATDQELMGSCWIQIPLEPKSSRKMSVFIWAKIKNKTSISVIHFNYKYSN